MNAKAIVTLVSLILLAALLVGCAEPTEVEVTRIVTEEVEVTRIVAQVEEVEVTRVVTEVEQIEVTRVVPMESVAIDTLADLARSIRNREIDVGDEYGMAEDQRFHVIHSDVIGMMCTQCHVEEAPLEMAQVLNISAEAPGPADRRVCLGCHLTGPAAKLYEPKE